MSKEFTEVFRLTRLCIVKESGVQVSIKIKKTCPYLVQHSMLFPLGRILILVT